MMQLFPTYKLKYMFYFIHKSMASDCLENNKIADDAPECTKNCNFYRRKTVICKNKQNDRTDRNGKS